MRVSNPPADNYSRKEESAMGETNNSNPVTWSCRNEHEFTLSSLNGLIRIICEDTDIELHTTYLSVVSGKNETREAPRGSLERHLETRLTSSRQKYWIHGLKTNFSSMVHEHEQHTSYSEALKIGAHPEHLANRGQSKSILTF